MPDEIKNDVFAIFDIYTSQISNQPPSTQIDELKEEISDLKEQLEIKKHEVETVD